MRALRPSLVGTVSICLLAGLSVAIWAQDEIPAPPTAVSGTVTEAWGFSPEVADTGQDERGDGVTVGRGYVEHQEVAWSDPRLPSTHWMRFDYLIYGVDEPEPVMTVTSSHLLLGPEGSWRGTGRALEWGDDERSATYELVGEGAYEGLYALLHPAPGPDTPGPWDEAYEGFIFEGTLPAFPEPAEPLDTEGIQHLPFPTEPPAD
jgi:hypothetical protein